jgi:acetyltransferase-like isoleucine patch superfamily enzyme
LTRCHGFKRFLLRCAGVKVGKNVEWVSSARIVTPNLEIGDNSFVGHDCLLIAAHGSWIRIGKNVDLGPRCTLVTGTHEIGGPDHRAGSGVVKDIVIEDGVWAGAGVTILAGVCIGRGSVLAAGAVVPKNVEENVLCGGNPLRVIRELPAAEPPRDLSDEPG